MRALFEIENGISPQNAQALHSYVAGFKLVIVVCSKPATPFNSLITFVN